MDSERKERPTCENTLSCVNSLYAWLLDRGFDVASVPLRIADFPLDSTGLRIRGLAASRDIDENEIILSIPRNCFVTLEVAAQNQRVQKVSETEPWMSLTNVDSQDLALAIFLIDARRNPESEWHVYARLLPESVEGALSENEVEQIAFTLRRQKAQRHLQKRRKRWVDVIEPIFALLEEEESFTEDAWRWASSVIDSRSFSFHEERNVGAPSRMGGQASPLSEHEELRLDDKKDFQQNKEVKRSGSYVMFPFADMFNHHPDGLHDFGYNSETQCFQFRTNKAIRAGQQVFLRYTSITRWSFWKNYGFVPQDSAMEGREVFPLEVPVQEAMEWLQCLPRDRDEIVGAAQFQWFKDKLLTKGCCVLETGKPNRALLSALRLLFLTGDEFEEHHKAFALPPLSVRNEYQVYLYLEQALEEALAGARRLTHSSLNATRMNEADDAVVRKAQEVARCQSSHYHTELRISPVISLREQRAVLDDIGPSQGLSDLLLESANNFLKFKEWDGAYEYT